jgi:hypothetical protein
LDTDDLDSFDLYGATLVQWFGVSAANILPIFPSLANFTPQNLGFLTPTDRLRRLRITSYPVSSLRERVGPLVLWPGPKSKMSDIIVVQDLVKNYGDFCAVNHISFTVPEGTIFGFLGPNGAGKTTTITDAARIGRALGPQKRLREAVFRRHETAARSGARAAAPAADSFSRRAHNRP